MSALTLLSVPHSDAVKTMVQENLKPGVSVADLVIDSPVAGQGLEMTSRINIAAGAYNNPGWPYYGETDFTFHALDMADTFAGLDLAFQMPVRFTSMELALRLGEALGLHFDPRDIFQEAVVLTELESVYTLRANPASERWQGSVAITIHADAPIEASDAN